MTMRSTSTHRLPAVEQPSTTAQGRRRTSAAVAAVVALGVLAVSACGDDGDAADAATTSTLATATAAAGAATSNSPPGTGFDAATPPPVASVSNVGTSGTVATAAASYASAPCPSPALPGYPQLDFRAGVTCGYLTVPENRSTPDGPTIRLLVATLKAASPTPAADPIVWLTGGAGSPIIADANVAADLGINADRDLILVEQRGNYSSEPSLVCPEVGAFTAAAVTKAYLDPATREQSKAATTACRDRFASTGIDLAAYSTAENASDIADLRVAMGIEEWNLYGYSYGTLLALTVLRDHPAGVRSVVLDSVVPPNLKLLEEFWPAAAAGYQAIFDACAAQPSCAAAYPNVAEELVATVNRLTTTPVTVPVEDPATGATVPVVIDGYKLANLLVQMGGAHQSFSEIPAIVHDLANGDGREAAALLLDISTSPPIGSTGLSLGVYCPEYGAQTSPSQVRTRGKEALPQFPDAVLEQTPQLPFFENCAIWDVGTAPPEVHTPVVSDVPVLMMAGTFDTITAVAWIEVVAPGLPNSQTVVVPGVGHETIKSGPCPVSMMNEFLDNPMEPVDHTCVDNLALPTFTTP
jgi:pimeloyl-ACP methyl ester carboxylesterase